MQRGHDITYVAHFAIMDKCTEGVFSLTFVMDWSLALGKREKLSRWEIAEVPLQLRLCMQFSAMRGVIARLAIP
jgi:hypothetical protein